MRKNIIGIVSIVIVLAACAPAIDKTPIPVITAISEMIPPENTVTPEILPPTSAPTPLPPIILPNPEPIHAGMLLEKDNGLFEVLIPEGLDKNHPAMPTYIWEHLQPNVNPGLAAIVIEFDMPGTVEKWHGDLFGYDRGFFVSLQNLETIPIQPLYINPEHLEPSVFDLKDIDREALLLLPELMVDLSHFSVNMDDHYIVRIPYEQLLGGAKDLTLQFLPGTVFGNLRVNLEHDGSLDQGILTALMEDVPRPQYDVNEIHQDWWEGGVDRNNSQEGFIEIIDSNRWINQGIKEYRVNPDGSVNIPVSEYDLGEYANEITGEFTVIPEGLLPILIKLEEQEYIIADNPEEHREDQQQIKEDRAAVVTFIMKNMIDPETGLIRGIWDNDQGQLVAENRRV
nr:hypothetical protein [Anaerolineaceae bacterium]